MELRPPLRARPATVPHFLRLCGQLDTRSVGGGVQMDDGRWTMDDRSLVAHRPSSIVHPETDIADGTQRLAAKSLVVLDPESGRYHMHESIRQYAADKLAEAGEAEAMRTSHLRYFTELAEAAWEPMRGERQAEWL